MSSENLSVDLQTFASQDKQASMQLPFTGLHHAPIVSCALASLDDEF